MYNLLINSIKESNKLEMTQRNILNNNELKYFYDSRKKFDKVISDIMGPDVHLHDISGESDDVDELMLQ